jgi:hypothetical protein
MNTDYEAYVLCPNRKAATAFRFLDLVMPKREEASSEYPFPESADSPSTVFANAGDLIRYLERHETDAYGIYWNNLDSGSPYQAMLFFTDDKGLIAGVVSDSPDKIKTLTQEADAAGGARHGMIAGAGRPPSSSEEFIVLCREADTERIVDGKLLSPSS